MKEHLFLGFFETEHFENMFKEAQILLHESKKEKEVFLNTDKTYNHYSPPIWFYKGFDKLVNLAKQEILTNKVKYLQSVRDPNLILEYYEALLNQISEFRFFGLDDDLVLEKLCTKFDTKISRLQNSSFDDMNLLHLLFVRYDDFVESEETSKLYNISKKEMYVTRGVLKTYYISKNLKELYQLIENYRSGVIKIDPIKLFKLIEMKYRERKKSKQRFSYLYKYFYDLVRNEQLSTATEFSTQKSFKKFVSIEYSERITNMNVTHNQNKGETYEREKLKLDKILKEILNSEVAK